jgi:hypothetical protein
VDAEELAKIQELLTAQIKERIPGDAIERVAVLQYGDDPAVEPGDLVIRIYLAMPGDGEERGRALHEFMRDNDEKLRALREDLSCKLPEAHRLEFRVSGDNNVQFMMAGPRVRMGATTLTGGELTPVMARLGGTDLETLDTLITAGIAGNRAEAVRWAIGRIRERPAYERLRERAREIEDLKSQF